MEEKKEDWMLWLRYNKGTKKKRVYAPNAPLYAMSL